MTPLSYFRETSVNHEAVSDQELHSGFVSTAMWLPRKAASAQAQLFVLMRR